MVGMAVSGHVVCYRGRPIRDYLAKIPRWLLILIP